METKSRDVEWGCSPWPSEVAAGGASSDGAGHRGPWFEDGGVADRGSWCDGGGCARRTRNYGTDIRRWAEEGNRARRPRGSSAGVPGVRG